VLQLAVANWLPRVLGCHAWWLAEKRRLAYRLHADLLYLWGEHPEAGSDYASDQVTVLVPTSPIPAHPDTAIIDEVINSIRAQPALRDAEIIIMADGVRPEQADRVLDYLEYRRRLLWKAHHYWHNVLVVPHWMHRHQAAMTRDLLDAGQVTTPLMLFVEHDTPLVGEVPWEQLMLVLRANLGDVVRLYHETVLQPEHAHLMLGAVTELFGAPLVRTVQWSQRPHLARRDYYARILAEHFSPQARTMIEDTMHGEVNRRTWPDHRLWLYMPEGNLQRSTHLDGRGADPKFDMVP
jgi:hypothetical protein